MATTINSTTARTIDRARTRARVRNMMKRTMEAQEPRPWDPKSFMVAPRGLNHGALQRGGWEPTLKNLELVERPEEVTSVPTRLMGKEADRRLFAMGEAEATGFVRSWNLADLKDLPTGTWIVPKGIEGSVFCPNKGQMLDAVQEELSFLGGEAVVDILRIVRKDRLKAEMEVECYTIGVGTADTLVERYILWRHSWD